MAATITFATGGGITDTAGQYTAVLSGNPGRDPVRVQFCDSAQEYYALPAHDVGAVYDIDIPDTRVDVTVRSSDGRPIAGAGVTATLFTDSTTRQISHNVDGPATNHDGKSAMLTLTPGETFRVCATHPDFAQRCSDALVLEDATSSESVTLTLPAARATAIGRVDSLRGTPRNPRHSEELRSAAATALQN
jgi:hypothetical protein